MNNKNSQEQPSIWGLVITLLCMGFMLGMSAGIAIEYTHNSKQIKRLEDNLIAITPLIIPFAIFVGFHFAIDFCKSWLSDWGDLWRDSNEEREPDKIEF